MVVNFKGEVMVGVRAVGISWRVVSESQRRAIEKGKAREMVNLRQSLMTKSSAVSTEAWTTTSQAVERSLSGE